jgi:CBS domain-containing protein
MRNNHLRSLSAEKIVNLSATPTWYCLWGGNRSIFRLPPETSDECPTVSWMSARLGLDRFVLKTRVLRNGENEMAATSLGTLVTYNPWSIRPTTLLDEVAARFHELAIHHVPVVDGERRVIGMLSETDLLRARQSQRMALVGGGIHDTDDAPVVFARDCMSRQVWSIGPDADFRTALALLQDHQIHALPVISGDRLTGMVTSRDFLREFSYGVLPGSREPAANLLRGIPPQPILPGTSLDNALLIMHERGASCLAVAEGDRPIGVLSQRDIIREKYRQEEQAEYHPEMPQDGTVSSVKRTSPPIRSGQRLFEAAAAMIAENLSAVTVVDQSSRLLGLIAEDDLLRVLYDALA